MTNIIAKSIYILIFIVITIYLIIIDKNKSGALIKIFKNKIFIINLTIALVFFIFINYVINNDNINLINVDKKKHKQLITSSHQALFGLVIAFFAHIDLIVSPFWFIFITSYILNLKI